jgi:O-antigen ligase
VTARGLRLAAPGAAALALAACWPLSAYAVGPAVLPALLAATAVMALVAVRLEAGVAIVLLLAPFTNAAANAGRPVRFVESGLALAVLAAAVLAQRRQRSASGAPGLSLGVLAFLLAGGVSSLAAEDPAKSLTRFLGLVTAAALFFAVPLVCRRRSQLVLVVAAALASLLLAGAQGAVQKAIGDTSFAGVVIAGQVVGRVAGSFSHPNQFAGFLICLIPLAAATLASRAAARPLRGLAAAALALALAALAFSLTRGAVLGLIAGSLLWVAVVRPRIAVPIAVVIGVVGLALVPSSLHERLSDPTGDDLGLRSDLWQSALDIYATSPVVGVGLANFGDAYSRLPAQLSTGTQRRLLHQDQLLVPPHANNLFLTILAEEGLLGALAFLGLMGAALWTCRRVARVDEPFARVVGVGLGAGLCAMLVHSVLEYTLIGEPSLPIFALLGVATALPANAQASAAGVRDRRPRAGAADGA